MIRSTDQACPASFGSTQLPRKQRIWTVVLPTTDLVRVAVIAQVDDADSDHRELGTS